MVFDHDVDASMTQIATVPSEEETKTSADVRRRDTAGDGGCLVGLVPTG